MTKKLATEVADNACTLARAHVGPAAVVAARDLFHPLTFTKPISRQAAYSALAHGITNVVRLKIGVLHERRNLAFG